MGRTALLAGASGLVGSHCLRLLLAEPLYDRITTLGRRPLFHTHPKLEQRVTDFERLAEIANLQPIDDAYCCLGTTMRRARSRVAFRRVDLTYVQEFARLAKRAGAARFLLVSALGAYSRSHVFYYRVKGEAEEAVRDVFGVGTHIFRPSLLTGVRAELRLGERATIAVARAVVFAMIGPLRRYRPIAAHTVARAMVRVALENRAGARVYRSDEIATLGAPGATFGAGAP